MYVYVFADATEVSHLKHNLSLREEILFMNTIKFEGHQDFVKFHR